MRNFITISEAAAVLRTSNKAISRLIAKGQLKAVLVGGGQQRKHYMINPTHLEELGDVQVTKKPRAVTQKRASSAEKWGL